MSSLILKRASGSRSFGQWRDDDYDVIEGGTVVGRIFKVPIALAETATRTSPDSACVPPKS